MVAEKLFFILAYEKNTSLQEFFVVAFDIEQAICNQKVPILAPLLAEALEPYRPKRDTKEVS